MLSLPPSKGPSQATLATLLKPTSTSRGEKSSHLWALLLTHAAGDSGWGLHGNFLLHGTLLRVVSVEGVGNGGFVAGDDGSVFTPKVLLSVGGEHC